MIRPYYVFKVKQLPGSRRRARGSYGNTDAAMGVVFSDKGMEDLVRTMVGYLSDRYIYPVGISFVPPVSVYVPPIGEPLLIIPFTKAEQKKFLSLLLKRKDVPAGVRRLLAA